ncbi:MAG: MarR family transcriptional regulator [Lachnospiraceae bacterium]|nr:MarR family transcriptional regulator [Lachnospiraceae bacterium]
MFYHLEIKQIVDYPRCRVYRDFLRDIMQDRTIRTNGESYLFYFMVLCSYANYRTSYRRLEGISYLVGPGEWVCTTSELSEWFRTRFQHQAVAILDYLQEQHYITYSRLGRGNLIKFTITGWNKSNTSFDYNYPCLKDVGFFFFPVSAVHELISMGKCSEMDIVLDLWIHAIYNDEQVHGSDIGPVVYFRNNTGNPLTNYSDLAERWGISKASVSRILNKLQEKEYLSLVSFTGRHGSVIYLCNYLSTMFSVSDVMIDKEEVSMTFQIPVQLMENVFQEDSTIKDEQIMIEEDSVSNEEGSVSDFNIRAMVRKVAKILSAQGVSCCECPRTQYKLYSLSDCKEGNLKYSLSINCPDGKIPYQFELTLTPAEMELSDEEKGGMEHYE